jgi:AmmeMemoRadiSam system protein B
MHRKPAVAGSFYPAAPAELSREISGYLDKNAVARRAVAVLVPHAGTIYSGPCAGRTYAHVAIPDLAVVLCPNHTGRGKPLALMDEGAWETPLGSVAIDSTLARRILACDPALEIDEIAHQREHALEVQLPFLQTLRPSIRIVPICVGTRSPAALIALGDALASSIREAGEPVLIVISSDMSHYIPLEEARARDALAISRMEKLDAEGLQEVVEREGISMCGYCPAVAGIRAASHLGATEGQLVAYTSSGDRTGSYEEIVAYAGMVFH